MVIIGKDNRFRNDRKNDKIGEKILTWFTFLLHNGQNVEIVTFFLVLIIRRDDKFGKDRKKWQIRERAFTTFTFLPHNGQNVDIPALKKAHNSYITSLSPAHDDFNWKTQHLKTRQTTSTLRQRQQCHLRAAAERKNADSCCKPYNA